MEAASLYGVDKDLELVGFSLRYCARPRLGMAFVSWARC